MSAGMNGSTVPTEYGTTLEEAIRAADYWRLEAAKSEAEWRRLGAELAIKLAYWESVADNLGEQLSACIDELNRYKAALERIVSRDQFQWAITYGEQYLVDIAKAALSGNGSSQDPTE